MKKDIGNKDKGVNIFINNNPEWGGTFQYTQLVTKALQNQFNENKIKFFYTQDVWKDNLKKNRYIIKLNYFSICLIQILIFLNIKKIPMFIKKNLLSSLPYSFFEKDELWIFPSQDIISILCGGKTVVSINDLMHRYCKFSETSSFFRKVYRDYKFSKISKNSYRVLVDSKLGKKHVKDCYGEYNNVKVQYFSALQEEKSNIKSNDMGKYLIYPAQYWEHKNHSKLLLAIKILKKKYSDIKLVLIGNKKKNYNKIKQLSDELGLSNNIIFLGFISDKEKASLIYNARALINPTYLGPTNIPQLEAFNYECPVILSNVFAAKEQCSDKVIYFDPNFEDSIAKSIEKIWDNDEVFLLYKKKSSEIAKKYSFKNFSETLIKNIS